MPYNRKTEFFKIPYVSQGEKILPAEEAKKANIIENQLIAGFKGVFSCVFEDGEYRIINNMDNSFTVMLVGTGENVALEGVVNGGLCKSRAPVMWEGLRSGSVYYLYVTHTPELYADEKAFKAISKARSPYPRNLRNYLLLARIDTTSKKPTLDANPDGKLYSNNLASHLSDTTNPHGDNQVQDVLTLRKELTFEHDGSGGAGSEVITLYDEKGNGVLNKLAEQKVCHFREKSGGKNGIQLQIPGSKEIESVLVCEFVAANNYPTFKIGATAARIDKPNRVTIYNSGSSGVMLFITVHYK